MCARVRACVCVCANVSGKVVLVPGPILDTMALIFVLHINAFLRHISLSHVFCLPTLTHTHPHTHTRIPHPPTQHPSQAATHVTVHP